LIRCSLTLTDNRGERGYLLMGGQIVETTLIAALKQCDTATETAARKEGYTAWKI
jgi:hypothetical protein